MFLNGLVQELAELQETSVQGVRALQTKHNELEVKILQAQERQQLVRRHKDVIIRSIMWSCN